MALDADSRKTPNNGFSFQPIRDIDAELTAAIKFHAAEIISLANAGGELQLALQRHLANRSIEQQNELLSVAQRCRLLLDGEGN